MTDGSKLKSKKSRSSIIGALKRLTDRIYKAAATGFFGRIFSSYTHEQRAFRQSFAVSVMGRSSRLASVCRKARFAVAEQFEESRLIHGWRKLINRLSHCSMRFYGTFLLTFGIYTGLVFFFKNYIINVADRASSSYIVFAVILSLASLPLLASKRTFARSVLTSRVGYFISLSLFGIPIEKFKNEPSRRFDSYNLAIVFGIFVGMLTYFVEPWRILTAIAVFAALAVVISYPEAGVITAITVLPLCSMIGDSFLQSVVIAYSLSYLLKLIRGKRVATFEITDLFTMFFGLLVLLGGLISASGTGFITASRVVVLMFGCFVAGNLMRTRQWQLRAMFALGASGYAVSLMVIWQAVAESIGSFFDKELWRFSDGVPFFGSNSMLSTFLLVSFMITLAFSHNATWLKAKHTAFLSAAVMLTALLLTDSTVGFAAVLIAVTVYFVMISRKTLTALLFSGMIAATALIIAPGGVIQKLVTIFGINSETVNALANIRYGCYNMISSSYFTGVGTSGFSEVYPMYAVSGFEWASDSSSMWLGVLSEQGILGVLLVSAVLFLTVQNCCEYIRRPFCKSSKALVAAGLAAMIGISVQALFADLWSEPGVFFLLWMLPAMLSSGIRGCRSEMEKEHDLNVGNEFSASVDI